jgi:RecB family exonuclease
MIGELRGSSIIYGRENWQSLGGKLGQFVEIVARQFSCETLAEYLSNYENLLMNLNYGRVEDLTEREKGVIESFWELLKSLIWLAKELKVGFNEFSRIMRYLLMQKRYFGEEKLIRGVGIMGMIEAGGVRAKAKFICGLIDGDEPKIKEWVLIPDAVMKIINLPTIEDQVKEQKYYFDLEMQSGAEIIYLTYPQLEGDRKTLCSFFMSDYLMSNKYDCIKVSSEGAYSLEEYLINKGEHRGIKLANYLEGINLSQSSKEYIDKYFDVHAINVGSIAKYYECPQEFYFSDVLLLAGEREPTFDYNAMEWGTTIHRILFQAFAEGERWKQRAYEEFNKASEVYPEGVREFFLKRFKLDIEFLEHIQNVLQEDYVVYERELKLESKLDLDDIVQKVKGVIDRVDIRKDGVGYLLIDYKVGSIEGRKHDLQLPLYAWLYKERSGVLPEKLILLSLNGLKSRIKDLTKKDLIIADALVKAKEIIKKIREGIFYNVEEEDDEVEVDNWKCRHCEFRHLCWQ